MSKGKLSTREKILQVIEGMEQAGSLMTISGVAKEAKVSNSTIHNRYPDLAERIRLSAGVVIEKDAKEELTRRLGAIKEEKAKRSRLREQLEETKELSRKIASVNATLQFENASLKARLDEERYRHRAHVANLHGPASKPITFYFSDLQSKTVPDQLFAFADAYLQSADALCLAHCIKAESATYAHGAVIMSLTFHALELFLKAAILWKSPTESFGGRLGHDLVHLEQRYASLYPEKELRFFIPFRLETPCAQEVDLEVTEEVVACVRNFAKNMPQDQLHRYPIGTDGESWRALLGFEPTSFYMTIKQLGKDLADIKARLDEGNGLGDKQKT